MLHAHSATPRLPCTVLYSQEQQRTYTLALVPDSPYTLLSLFLRRATIFILKIPPGRILDLLVQRLDWMRPGADYRPSISLHTPSTGSVLSNRPIDRAPVPRDRAHHLQQPREH